MKPDIGRLQGPVLLVPYVIFLTLRRYWSPAVPEDLSTMFPNFAWEPLLDGRFEKLNTELDFSFLNGIPWGPAQSLLEPLGVEYWHSLLLVDLLRHGLLVFLLYQFFRHFGVNRLLAVAATVISQSTLSLSEVYNHSPRYSSLVVFLSVLIFTMRMVTRRTSARWRWLNFLLLLIAALVVPGVFSNLANALTVLIVIPATAIWALSAKLSPQRAVLWGTGAVLAVTILWLPAYLVLLSQTPFDGYSLSRAVAFFPTTSVPDLLQGRGAWWERNYLPWSSAFDDGLRQGTRTALNLVTLFVFLIGLDRLAPRWRLWGVLRSGKEAAQQSSVLALLSMVSIGCIVVVKFLLDARWMQTCEQESCVSPWVRVNFLLREMMESQLVWALLISLLTIWSLSRSKIADQGEHQKLRIVTFAVLVCALVLSFGDGRFVLLTVAVASLVVLTIWEPVSGSNLAVSSVACFAAWTASPTLGLVLTAWCLASFWILRPVAPKSKAIVLLGLVFIATSAFSVIKLSESNSITIGSQLEQVVDKDNSYRTWLLGETPECAPLNEALAGHAPWTDVPALADVIPIQCPDTFLALVNSGGPMGSWLLSSRNALWTDYLGFLNAPETPFGSLFVPNALSFLLALLAGLLVGLATWIQGFRGMRLSLAASLPILLVVPILTIEWWVTALSPSLGILAASLSTIIGLGSLLVIGFVVGATWRRYRHRSVAVALRIRKELTSEYATTQLRKLTYLVPFTLVLLLLSFWLWSALVSETLPYALAFREPWSKFTQFFIIYLSLCNVLALGILIRLISVSVRLKRPLVIAIALVSGFLILYLDSYMRVNVVTRSTAETNYEWAREISNAARAVPEFSSVDIREHGVCLSNTGDIFIDILYGRWILGSLRNVPMSAEAAPELEGIYTQLGQVVSSCALDAPEAFVICVPSPDPAIASLRKCDLSLPSLPITADGSADG